MALIGRGYELDKIRSLFADCINCSGQVILINGAGASGKTTLLQELANHVLRAGGIALASTCAQSEQCEPLGVASQLVRSVALPEEVTTRVKALITASERADYSSPEHRTHDLAEIVLAVSRGQPVALIVDDVEFIDEATKQSLRYLQRRISSARVMIALAQSTHAGTADPLFLADLTRQPYYTQLTLSPLGSASMRELIVAHLGEAAEGLAAECHRLSGGNPMLAQAFIEDTRMAHLTGGKLGQLAVGDAYRHAVIACLHRWEPDVLACARGLAVLGAFANPATVRHVLGDGHGGSGTGAKLTAAAVLRSLAALNSSGLTNANRFLHPAAEQAVLADIPPDMSSLLHARTAERMHVEGAPAIDIARHLLATDEPPGEWAVPVLERAAEQALTEDRISHAVEFLELARTACAHPTAMATLTVRLAGIKWQLSPAAAARHLEELQAAVLAGHVGWREALLLVRHLLWQGRMDEAATLLGWFDDSAPEPRSQWAGDLSGILRWVRHFHPPLYQRARTLAQPVRSDVTDGIRLPAVIGSATVAADEETTGWAERLLQGCRPTDTPLESVLSALFTLIYADQLDRASHWCETIGAAIADEAATWTAALADVRSHIALRRGELPRAEHFAKVALTALPPHNWGVAIGSPLANLITAATAMGDSEQAEKALRYAVPDAMRTTWFWPLYLRARGTYYLHRTDRLRAALDDFETCGALATAWGMDDPVLMPWRTDAAQVLVRMGMPDKARELVRAQLGGTARTSSRVRGLSLRVLASTADLTRRLPILRESVELLQDSGDLLELSVALAGLSNAHSNLGEFSHARLIARRAIQTAKTCHAEATCHKLLPRATVVTCSDDPTVDTDIMAALSEAERRVATLAAAGHTNREIGRKLFITVSTVEQHLTRVYRKLHVTRRTELPGELHLSTVTRS